MCSSRKYPCPPQGRFMEIPKGRGVEKPNFLNERVTLKWNFPREGYGYFLVQYNSHVHYRTPIKSGYQLF